MRFWPTFIGSFQSPSVYHRVRYEYQGWGMWYAFVLVALTTLIGSLWLLVTVHNVALVERDGRPSLMQSALTQIARQLPVMRIADGRITVEGQQPVRIFVREKIAGYEFNEPLITIDTTGATTYENMQTPMLITDGDIIARKSNGETSIRSVGDLIPNDSKAYTDDDLRDVLVALPEAMRKHIWKFYLIALPVLWGMMTAAFFITRAIMILVIGVVANIVGSVTNGDINYMTAVRISAVAYTPVAVFNALAFVLVFDTAGSLTLFLLGSIVAGGAVRLTNPEARKV